MNWIYSFCIASWMNNNILMKPMGERSLFEEMFIKKCMICSSILMAATVYRNSTFLSLFILESLKNCAEMFWKKAIG